MLTTVPGATEGQLNTARFRPDVAVLDVMLPGQSGLAPAGHLRRNTRTAVVFVTARDAVTDRLAGFDAGADDYLVKPFVRGVGYRIGEATAPGARS